MVYVKFPIEVRSYWMHKLKTNLKYNAYVYSGKSIQGSRGNSFVMLSKILFKTILHGLLCKIFNFMLVINQIRQIEAELVFFLFFFVFCSLFIFIFIRLLRLWCLFLWIVQTCSFFVVYLTFMWIFINSPPILFICFVLIFVYRIAI